MCLCCNLLFKHFIYYCPCSGSGLSCFHPSFFLSVSMITHEPTAIRSLMKFCTNVFPQPRGQIISRTSVKGQGDGNRFSDFLPLRDRAKKFVGMITHEPLHLAWWYFARTCTSATAWTLLNFKVVGQRSRLHGCATICVHDAAAARGQYLALSKAWWSSFSLSLLQFGMCTTISEQLSEATSAVSERLNWRLMQYRSTLPTTLSGLS